MLSRPIPVSGLLLLSAAPFVQAQSPVRSEGSAIVRTERMEYLIPIICDDALRPAAGFSTEPARVTREATGRSSPVNLRLRRWQETDELIATFEGYVAWLPSAELPAPLLSMSVSMSPVSLIRNGLPVTLTYDMWMNGDRPEGIEIAIEVDCRTRDPAAPLSRPV